MSQPSDPPPKPVETGPKKDSAPSSEPPPAKVPPIKVPPFEKGPEKASEPAKSTPVEVMPSEPALDELTSSNPQPNVRRSWMPWKRANRRDQQLAQLRDGYSELIGLIRNISGHLERDQQETSSVNTLIETLPPALNSFEKLATNQQQVTAILGRINSHMEDSNTKDKQLLENMQGFNKTIKEVSSTNETAVGTLGRVQERIGESDERMKSLFDQASQTNEVVGGMMMRLEKRLFISNLILIILLALLILVGGAWMLRQQSSPPAPQPVAPLAPAPSAPATTPTPISAEPALDEASSDEGSLLNEVPLENPEELELPLHQLSETPLPGILMESPPAVEPENSEADAEEAQLPAFPSIPANEPDLPDFSVDEF